MASFTRRVASRLSALRSRQQSQAPEASAPPPAVRQRLESQRKRIATLENQVGAQGRRLRELEAELVEDRMMGRRIAELVDVVEQLLLSDDVRDSSRVEERLAELKARR
jgi:uncharacterized coiled-coil protein SlyX